MYEIMKKSVSECTSEEIFTMTDWYYAGHSPHFTTYWIAFAHENKLDDEDKSLKKMLYSSVCNRRGELVGD